MGKGGQPLAVIAGSGRFPFLVAEEAKRRGHTVYVFGIKRWADPSLAEIADTYEELEVGALDTLLDRLREKSIREAIMAGKVTKQALVDSSTSFDARTQGLLGRLKNASVKAILGQIGRVFAKEGVKLLDSSSFLKHLLCPKGVLTAEHPSETQQADIRFGMQVARTVASLDIGQTVVVKKRVVIAVEALEGTDAAIRRAHELAGDGLVVVKLASPSQDMRFDIPVLGREGLAVFKEAGVACVAVQANKTLLLDRDALVAEANEVRMCLVGVEPRFLAPFV